MGMTMEWPRARQWEVRLPLPLGCMVGLQAFTNPDAGVRFELSVIRGRTKALSAWSEYTGLVRLGPGQCGERTWNRITNRWCTRPFGHDGTHHYLEDDQP